MGDEATVPRHIAVIMDGNGRWARQRGLPRIEGHRRGIESVREIVTELAKRGDVRYLTLYAFSTENWERPKREIASLMRLLKRFCRGELKTMMDNSIRFTTIGAPGRLPGDVRDELDKTIRATAANRGLTLCLALDYGGRDEIVRAARGFAADAAAGKAPAGGLDEKGFSERLDTAGMPDPDLLIRTAGERRLSNFLLWQVSYAELYFTDVLWPEFRKEHLNAALEDYAKRTRKYGAVGDA
jgi:undecaprenyl diphosphate synthase